MQVGRLFAWNPAHPGSASGRNVPVTAATQAGGMTTPRHLPTFNDAASYPVADLQRPLYDGPGTSCRLRASPGARRDVAGPNVDAPVMPRPAHRLGGRPGRTSPGRGPDRNVGAVQEGREANSTSPVSTRGAPTTVLRRRAADLPHRRPLRGGEQGDRSGRCSPHGEKSSVAESSAPWGATSNRGRRAACAAGPGRRDRESERSARERQDGSRRP